MLGVEVGLDVYCVRGIVQHKIPLTKSEFRIQDRKREINLCAVHVPVPTSALMMVMAV